MFVCVSMCVRSQYKMNGFVQLTSTLENKLSDYRSWASVCFISTSILQILGCRLNSIIELGYEHGEHNSRDNLVLRAGSQYLPLSSQGTAENRAWADPGSVRQKPDL
jgi:hypothetical protein